MHSLILIAFLLTAAVAAATPAHDAATRGDVGALQALVRDTPSTVDTKDAQGRTPLFIALDRGRNRASVVLLEGGADWRKIGNRAVAMAVRTKNVRAAELMIDAGAPVNTPDREGYLPVARAVMRGDMTMTALLVDKGADPDAVVAGDIPLVCWAAANGFADVVGSLIEGGVDLSAVDPTGDDALSLARNHGHPAVAGRLEAAGMSTPAHTLLAEKLARPVPTGDAVFWHLGHCGWAVRTANHVLVFDYYPDRTRPETPALSNGFLSREELAGHDVTVFVTHGHRDHFDSAIYALAGDNVNYVYGFEPGTPGCGFEGRYTGPAFIHAPPRTRHDVSGITVETIESNDLGVGFVVTVDGVTLYHAGDHAGWNDGEKDGYTREIDHIVGLGHRIDAAFLNVTGCHTGRACPLEDAVRYTLAKLEPTIWFPTHAGGSEHVYAEFAVKIEGSEYPSRMIRPVYRGDVFFYGGGNEPQRP